MKKLFLVAGLGLVCMNTTALAADAASEAAIQNSETAAQSVESQILAEWNEFHSVAGRCRVKFPSNPEHVTQKLTTPEIGYDLRYDAYISSLDKQTVFMLLVAQYPDYVDQTYAQLSLEAFLNGILTYNPENQLIFADLLLVNGHEALDFFIRAGSVYFKGRAMMVKNSLYLVAMECDVQIYDEQNYNKFVDSFQLVVPELKTK
ncbi:MAG: hypothetical protein KGZ30_01850 [Anaplasmataceae bacterium]|nr:hypothetical protein [Anaplasmataceae bacterium]